MGWVEPQPDLLKYLSHGYSSSVYLMSNAEQHVKKVYKDPFSKDHEIAVLKAIPAPLLPGGQGPAPWLHIINGEVDDDTAILAPYGEPLRADTCTVAVLEDYVNAIRHIHTHNYAHNDLRLPNLLVHQHRGLVIDFGFACPLGDKPQGGTRRAVGSDVASVIGDLVDFVKAIASLFSEQSVACAETLADALKAAHEGSYDNVLLNLTHIVTSA